jgi:transposase
VLERDGWAPDRRFEHATNQSCLAHLLRRYRELLSDAVAGQPPPRGAPHPKHALALRGGRDAGAPEAGRLIAEVQALEAAVDRLVAGATRYPPNRRLLDHLARERDHLFTFLRVPGVQATNWRAEHAIGPAVVCHKAWGGNHTVSRMPSPVAFLRAPSKLLSAMTSTEGPCLPTHHRRSLLRVPTVPILGRLTWPVATVGRRAGPA